MKKLTLFAICLCSALSAMAQGTVNFANFASGVDAKVTDATAANAPAAGSAYKATLYYAAAGVTDPAQFTSLGNAVSFSTGGGAGYFLGGATAIPGFATGSTVNIMVRAFATATGATYEAAGTRGSSNIVPVSLGGGVVPTPNLVGLQAFSVTSVPEPSTIALGMIGVGALLVRRIRRK